MDSSVLFSAAFSAQGGSRELIRMAIRGEATLVISDYVIEETKRNLSRKAPQAGEITQFILSQVPFEIANPEKHEVLAAGLHVELKDAPVVAAAKKANVDLLTTLDKKHLLEKSNVAEFAGVPIVTPEDAITYLRKTKRSS